MAAGDTDKGGYDYEFVDPDESPICPVCLLTLRDPHMISCCCHEFCERCIARVQRDGKPCPLCNEPNFTTMLNKKLVREVNALVIRCPQKELGCDWEGELGQLKRHLNPGAGVVSSKGCDFVMVECVYQCGTQLQRRLIQEHEMEICPKRPIEMQVATLMKKFEAVITENQVLKQELDETKKIHQEGMVEVKQELNDLKQAHREQREELHEAKEKNKLLQRVNENLQSICDVLKEQQKRIETNVDDLQKRKIVALENKCASLQTATMPLPVPPFYILVANFDHYRVHNHIFKSDPFYSHPAGYKLVVIIRPNGNGERKGTHVSLHVHLLPGEFDDQLRWPFSGKITVQAYSRTKEQWSFQRVIEMNERKWSLAVVNKCVDVPIAGGGAGCNDFLSFIFLDNYLKGANSLRIRITGIELV